MNLTLQNHKKMPQYFQSQLPFKENIFFRILYVILVANFKMVYIKFTRASSASTITWQIVNVIVKAFV